jgi:hypothetical protein
MQFQPILDAVAEGKSSDYDKLPEPIKHIVSEREYLWLSDNEKAHLIEQECDPEW